MKYKLQLSILILAFSCSRSPDAVYQWRGENRGGIYPDMHLLKTWPEEGPEEMWFTDSLGNGFGSPVFEEDRLYISGEIDSMAILHCLDLEGESVWQTTLGKEWVVTFPGSRSTPTVVGDLLYIGTGIGDLYCVEKKNGKLLWSRQLTKDFNGIHPLHGHSESPVVYRDKVFWNPGGKEISVVALDRFSGELVWSHPGMGERSGYNQGQLIDLKDRAIYVTFSAYFMMGFDTETGEMLWSQEQVDIPPEERIPGYSDGVMNAVIFEDGYMYLSAVAGRGETCLSLSEDGTSIKELWRNILKGNLMGGLVLLGDYLYGHDYFSIGLHSVNKKTGAIRDSLDTGSGVVIAADSMLYFYSQRGEMKLVRTNDGALEEVSSFSVAKGTGQHFSHPVIHDGVLYIRRGQGMMAFDLKNNEPDGVQRVRSKFH